MSATGFSLKNTLPWTFALPAAGFSFSTPLAEWITSSASGLDDDDTFVFELSERAEFVFPEFLQASTTTAKRKIAITASLFLCDMYLSLSGFDLMTSSENNAGLDC
jgi:hypothetical protein